MKKSVVPAILALAAAGGSYVLLLARWFHDPAVAGGGPRQTSVLPFVLLFAACAGLVAFRFRRRLGRMRAEIPGVWGLTRPELCAWATVIAVSFLFQLPTMLYPAALLHSDASINGLMAIHIAAGRAAPAFYYGQEFMGTLFSHALALLFVVTGPFVAGLALMTWLFYAGFVTATFLLVRQATAPSVAFATALWLAVTPYSLLIMMARSEYPQLFLLAASALVVFAARAGGRVNEDTWWLVVGALLGLTFWSHPLGFVVALAVAASAAILLPLRRVVEAAVWVGPGFAAGVAPAVVGWGSRMGRFAEWFVEGGGRGGEETLASATGGMFGVSLPNIMLGVEGRAEAPAVIAMLLGAVLVVSVCVILLAGLRSRRRATSAAVEGGTTELARAAAALPVCLFVLIHVTLLVGRRYDVVPAQYVIPLHLGIPTVVAIAAYWLLRPRSAHAAALTAAALLVWAAAPLPASSAWLRTLPENQASMDASIAALRSTGMDACIGPYWDAYRLSYLTLEAIVCESTDVRRVPGYADEVARRSPDARPPFVAAPQREDALRDHLQTLEAGGVTSTRIETPRFIALIPSSR